MINETYVECLVKAQSSLKFKIIKTLLIIATVISALFSLALGPWMITLALVFGLSAFTVSPLVHIEYEYLYVDRDLTVDKILNRKSRKRVATYSLSKIEIMAPFRSYRLDDYRNRQVTEKDYSIGKEEKPDRRYVMYYEGNQRIILSPSEELIQAMKYVAPRKVFTD